MPRNRAWADTVYKFKSVASEGNDLQNLLLNAPTVDTLTAVRIVVDLHCSFEAGVAFADAANSLHVGIGVTSVEAFNQGINAIPEPQFSTQYPPRGWLYVATRGVSMSVESAVGFTINGADFSADLRSMRKVDKGILFCVIQNIGDLNTRTIDFTGRIRVLCLT